MFGVDEDAVEGFFRGVGVAEIYSVAILGLTLNNFCHSMACLI